MWKSRTPQQICVISRLGANSKTCPDSLRRQVINNNVIEHESQYVSVFYGEISSRRVRVQKWWDIQIYVYISSNQLITTSFKLPFPTIVNSGSLSMCLFSFGPGMVTAFQNCYQFGIWNSRPRQTMLTHWGRVAHICLNKLAMNGSDHGLLPDRRQAIIWTNAGIFLIVALITNKLQLKFNRNSYIFLQEKMHLKISSAKWRPCCPGEDKVIPDIANMIYWGSIHWILEHLTNRFQEAWMLKNWVAK